MRIEIDESNYFGISHSPEEGVMREREFIERLTRYVKANISGGAVSFSIEDLSANDCYLLVKDGGFWSVSYWEKGRRHRPALFSDIEDAGVFFIEKIRGTTLNNFFSVKQ